MKVSQSKRDKCVLIPKDVRDAICIGAANGDGIRTIARRHKLGYAEIFGVLAQRYRAVKADAFQRGFSQGKLLRMPDLPPRRAA